MKNNKINLSSKQLAEIKKLALSRFRLFAELLWSPDYFDRSLHGTLCDFLQSGLESTSQPKDRLIVLPRTHLKTTIGAMLFALFIGTKYPSLRTLVVSNSATNAGMTVDEITSQVESHPLYQALFPERIPDFQKVSWTSKKAVLNRPQSFPEGTWEAAGVGSNIIRRHYDVIIEDDTVAPKKDELSGQELLPSKAEIEKAVNFHKLTIPLLTNPGEGMRVVIGTRWASYDLINYIKNHELSKKGERGRFKEMDLPAYKEDADGKKTPRYKRFSEDTLKSIRRTLGPMLFSALYLNEPRSTEQMKFKPEWIKYYEDDSERFQEAKKDGTNIVTIDPADPPTGKKTQSYTGIVSALHSEKGIFVRRTRKKRMTEHEQIKACFDIAETDGASVIRVEIDRYAHLVQAFKLERKKRGIHVIVQPVKTRGRKKEARIMRVAPIAENGLLFLKKNMKDLENEMFQFPFGDSDDVLDALAWHIDKNLKLPDFSPLEEKEKEPSNPLQFTFDQIQETLRPRAEGRKYMWKERSLSGRWN